MWMWRYARDTAMSFSGRCRACVWALLPEQVVWSLMDSEILIFWYAVVVVSAAATVHCRFFYHKHTQKKSWLVIVVFADLLFFWILFCHWAEWNIGTVADFTSTHNATITHRESSMSIQWKKGLNLKSAADLGLDRTLYFLWNLIEFLAIYVKIKSTFAITKIKEIKNRKLFSRFENVNCSVL